MRMYLAAKPEWKGDGVMHFYDGELHIHAGVVEVDPRKETWIQVLRAEGWAPLEEAEESESTAPVEQEAPRSSTPPRRKKANTA